MTKKTNSNNNSPKKEISAAVNPAGRPSTIEGALHIQNPNQRKNRTDDKRRATIAEHIRLGHTIEEIVNSMIPLSVPEDKIYENSPIRIRRQIIRDLAFDMGAKVSNTRREIKPW